MKVPKSTAQDDDQAGMTITSRHPYIYHEVVDYLKLGMSTCDCHPCLIVILFVYFYPYFIPQFIYTRLCPFFVGSEIREGQ